MHVRMACTSAPILHAHACHVHTTSDMHCTCVISHDVHGVMHDHHVHRDNAHSFPLSDITQLEEIVHPQMLDSCASLTQLTYEETELIRSMNRCMRELTQIHAQPQQQHQQRELMEALSMVSQHMAFAACARWLCDGLCAIMCIACFRASMP